MTTEEVSFVTRPDLSIRMLPNQRVEIAIDDDFHQLPGIALSILDVFTKARTVEEGQDLLIPRITDDEERTCLYDTVTKLLCASILIPVPGEQDLYPPSFTRGYAAPRIHVSMLRDEARTKGYLNAIRETVGPEDVVLDIGTGTGVLAVTAAEAGARHVYAIEANRETARYAKALIAGSSARDRITLVEGWSTEVRLPERCDVLVSEMIGDDPLDENILGMTADAMARHLKPGARLIPNRLDIFAQPVRLPLKRHAEQFFTEADIAKWEAGYGLNFRPLLATNPRQTMETILPQETRTWELAGAPRKLTSIDLTEISGAVFDEQFDFPLGDKVANGVLIYFETTLSKSHQLATSPAEVNDSNHWLSPCHMFRSEYREVLPLGFRYGISEALDGLYLRD